MDARLKPVPSLEEQLAFESFGSISPFSCAEFGSQCRPWTVQHPGNVGQSDISGTVAKPDRRLAFRVPFQSTAEDFQ